MMTGKTKAPYRARFVVSVPGGEQSVEAPLSADTLRGASVELAAGIQSWSEGEWLNVPEASGRVRSLAVASLLRVEVVTPAQGAREAAESEKEALRRKRREDDDRRVRPIPVPVPVPRPTPRPDVRQWIPRKPGPDPM